MNKEVENELKKSRVDFVHFVDISKLTNKQNRGLPCAILIGIAINPKFVKDVFNNPDYKPVLEDEYVKTENRVGEVTDELAEFLVSKGYKALSQSDAGLLAEGVFNFETKESVLPHKTVAQLSGLGWIGKNNLYTQFFSYFFMRFSIQTIGYKCNARLFRHTSQQCFHL